MKVPKFIARGLASGAIRLRPEVMEAIEKLNGDSNRGPETAPVEEQAPKPPSQEKDTPEPPATPSRSERRLIFVSPLAGRWIRWSYLALAIAGLCLTRLATAGENPSAFDTANQAFVEGKPAESARTLEGVIAKQGYSAPALYNLANAQLRSGDTGRAILNFERARWLAPSDPDIATNLRLARERTQPALAAAEPLRLVDWSTMSGWATLGAGSILLLAASLPLGLLLPRRKPVLRLARILAVMTLAGSLAAIGVRWGELNRAVVIAKAADARISPVTVGQPIFTLPEGTVVNIVKSHGSFALVSARYGQQGWVNRDTIEPVIASADWSQKAPKE